MSQTKTRAETNERERERDVCTKHRSNPRQPVCGGFGASAWTGCCFADVIVSPAVCPAVVCHEGLTENESPEGCVPESDQGSYNIIAAWHVQCRF